MVGSGRISNSSDLVTRKNEEDTIKNGSARMFTTFYIDFSDAEGQVTPKSVAISG